MTKAGDADGSRWATWLKRLGWMTAGAAVLAIVLALATQGGSEGEAFFPDGGPAEFLYLDSPRVAAYLAQVEGGSYNKEKLTRKLTRSLSGELSIPNAAKVGASTSSESFVEREITPTAASNYFHLLLALQSAGKLKEIGLGRFKSDVMRLPEGRFVRFETHSIKPPVYLNPFLVVRQSGTLAAIFPQSESSAEQRRMAAEGFANQVGDNPRVVFALHPAGTAGSGVQYLLPFRYQQMTDERSLIKNGGGEFTVVGKVVRVFPESRTDEDPPYVDTPTHQTWSEPLRHAPIELLRRSSHECSAKATSRQGSPGADARLRSCFIDALDAQTKINSRGAVILPLAIYK